MPFSDIVGQDQAVHLVQTLLRKGIIAGSHLVYGPGGVGELDLVRGICRALFCEKGNADFCGACSNCKRVEHGAHGDVHWLSAKTDWYAIEQIRELSRVAGMHPYESDYQVFVLEEAERMRVEAANCLLKTLEEPSPFTVIILITSSPSALLPTILSRCRRIRLASFSRNTLVELLVKRGMSRQDAMDVSDHAGGRMDRIDEILSGEFLSSQRQFVETLQKIRSEGDLGAFGFAGALRDREGAYQVMNWFARIVHSALVARSVSQGTEYEDRIRSLFEGFSDKRMMDLFEKSAEACQSIRGNANIELVVGSVMTDFAGGRAAGVER